MTERNLVEALIARLKIDLPGACIFKHAETLTAGIPDLSVSVHGATCWIEVKYLRKGKRLKDVVKRLQVIIGHQLAVACAGRCWTVVYEQDPKHITIWRPKALMASVWPDLSSPYGTLGLRVHGEPERFHKDKGLSIRQVVNDHGAIRVSGWPHELVGQLVLESCL